MKKILTALALFAIVTAMHGQDNFYNTNKGLFAPDSSALGKKFYFRSDSTITTNPEKESDKMVIKPKIELPESPSNKMIKIPNRGLLLEKENKYNMPLIKPEGDYKMPVIPLDSTKKWM